MAEPATTWARTWLAGEGQLGREDVHADGPGRIAEMPERGPLAAAEIEHEATQREERGAHQRPLRVGHHQGLGLPPEVLGCGRTEGIDQVAIHRHGGVREYDAPPGVSRRSPALHRPGSETRRPSSGPARRCGIAGAEA